MSSPSMMTIIYKSGKRRFHFINAGWVVTEEDLLRSMKDSYEDFLTNQEQNNNVAEILYAYEYIIMVDRLYNTNAIDYLQRVDKEDLQFFEQE